MPIGSPSRTFRAFLYALGDVDILCLHLCTSGSQLDPSLDLKILPLSSSLGPGPDMGRG
ncbi:rCG51519 [Rattus norvegicus]|uniref:RCG51519 n=1 Tax=Rattus norvegicus TaxID=10116 RepID=A6IZK2_RAT|nr:rCG51519 [Rattus norvegicus]